MALAPIINGTEKQIAYATAIRDAALNSVLAGAPAAARAGFEAKLAPHTDAVKWIEAAHTHHATIEANGLRNAKAVIITVVG